MLLAFITDNVIYMTNKTKNISIGDAVIVTTQNDLYVGDVLEITDTQLTMTYFNSLKDQVREVEIMLDKIERVEEDI